MNGWGLITRLGPSGVPSTACAAWGARTLTSIPACPVQFEIDRKNQFSYQARNGSRFVSETFQYSMMMTLIAGLSIDAPGRVGHDRGPAWTSRDALGAFNRDRVVDVAVRVHVGVRF